MEFTENQIKSKREWDRNNMKTFSCRMRRDYAEYFTAYCKAHNTSPNRVLKKCVLDCIRQYGAELEEQERSGNARK